MFNLDFFREHQKTILQLVNSPIGGLVRRSLWIDDMKNKVVCITPNSYHVELPNGKYKFTGYINDQYSEALRKSYRPLWELIHAFDMRFANRYMPALNLGFDSYSSQPAEADANDTYNAQNATTTNYGTDQYILVGDSNTETNSQCRGFVKWDYSSLPPNAIIDGNVTMDFRAVNQKITGGPHTYRIYKCLRNWVEGQLTWIIYSTGNNWGTVGGARDDVDCSSTNGGSFSMSGPTDTGAKSITLNAQGITDTQAQIAGTNYGWQIFISGDDNQVWLASSTYATASYRPKISFDYLSLSGVIFFM